MKSMLGFMALTVLLGFQTASSNSATELTAEPSIPESTTVTGEVLMIAGTFYLTQDAQGNEVLEAKDEIYMVKEETGNKVPVQVDEKTKLDLPRRVSTGDKIEAVVSKDGYAIAIKPAE